MPDSSPLAALKLYIAHREDPIEYIGLPKLRATRDASAGLSFDHRGYLIPFKQSIQAQVIAKINGVDFLYSNLTDRSSKEYGSSAGPFFTYNARGYYAQLRRNPITRTVKGTIGGILDLLLADSGSAPFVRSIVYKTVDIYDFDSLSFKPLKDFVIRNPIPIYGPKLDEAITIILGGLASWYYNPQTRDIVIYHQEKLNKLPTLDLDNIARGCSEDWSILDIEGSYQEGGYSRAIHAKDADSLQHRGGILGGAFVQQSIGLFGADTQQFNLLDKTNKIIRFVLQGEVVDGDCATEVLDYFLQNVVDQGDLVSPEQTFRAPGSDEDGNDDLFTPIEIIFNCRIIYPDDAALTGYRLRGFCGPFPLLVEMLINDEIVDSYSSPTGDPLDEIQFNHNFEDFSLAGYSGAVDVTFRANCASGETKILFLITQLVC